MNIMIMTVVEGDRSVPDIVIIDTNKLSDSKTKNLLHSAAKELDGANALYVFDDDDFSDGSAEIKPPCMVDKMLTIWIE